MLIFGFSGHMHLLFIKYRIGALEDGKMRIEYRFKMFNGDINFEFSFQKDFRFEKKHFHFCCIL